MNTDPFQAYCESVCAMVRWKPYHAAISAELTAHMQDHADALTAGGMEYPQAREAAAAAMGDPAELGRELNALHLPWWPLLARLMRFLALALVVLAFVLPYISGFSFGNPSSTMAANPAELVLVPRAIAGTERVVATGGAKGGGQLGHYTLSDEGSAALIYVDGSQEGYRSYYALRVVFSTTKDLFWLSPLNFFYIKERATDNLGGEYPGEVLDLQSDAAYRRISVSALPEQTLTRQFYYLEYSCVDPKARTYTLELGNARFTVTLDEEVEAHE